MQKSRKEKYMQKSEKAVPLLPQTGTAKTLDFVCTKIIADE